MTTIVEAVERIPIAVIPKNAREEVRVELFRLESGSWRLAVRTWFRENDKIKPTRNGITLPVDAVSKLAGALTAAAGEVQSRGLIE